jgi:hypothetical protein
MSGTLVHSMPCADRHDVSDVVESGALPLGCPQLA